VYFEKFIRTLLLDDNLSGSSMRIMKTSLRLEDVEKSYLGFMNSSARDALHRFAGGFRLGRESHACKRKASSATL